MFSQAIHWIAQACINLLTAEPPYDGIPSCNFERIRYEVRPCDVLLIEGRSNVSAIIQSITQSSWSHAVLYIGRLHDIENPKIRNVVSSYFSGPADTQLVIESILGKGTIVSNLSNYEKENIRLCRPKGLSRQDAQKIINIAVRKLGSGYDVRQILDIARFLLPWTIMPRRLRSKLFEHNAGESTKTVCSSMLAEAFASVQFPILPLVQENAEQGIELVTRNPKLYTPRDFDYSPYFEIIKYPFVEFSDYALYRKLPWNKEGLISHDEAGVGSINPPVAAEDETPPIEKKKKFFALKRLTGRLHKDPGSKEKDASTTPPASIARQTARRPS